ncbi:MAG: serine protease [Steroidobacteraceae bacterium]
MATALGFPHRLVNVIIGLATLLPTLAIAQGLAGEVQQHVRAATFEVVQSKPDEGAVTYERALPMELIPYQQRIDKYRSIGTAFAVGANRFVTAAHVLRIGMGSQFGPPALRDAAGEVYAIDQILKFSQAQDFAEFSLRNPPKSLRPLALGGAIALNDPVFAVGNALGEGIVIRDGVYTSETPEEVEGRWKWVRFSAAASPGNSGGPLVDKDGQVIGVVLRKSASENLNYAAPIKLVEQASDSTGTVEEHGSTRLPIMDVSETIVTNERIALPRPLVDFYTALRKITTDRAIRGDEQLLAHNKDRLFPGSASSQELLHEILRSPFPRVIREGQDHLWTTAAPKEIQTAQLDHNGFVQYGGNIFRLRAPDDLKLASLYTDSKLQMDLLLKSGFALHRAIGTDSIKVTSLGKASEEFAYSDAYGRVWQVKVWNIPFDDLSVVALSQTTPEGMIATLSGGPTGLKDVFVHQQEVIANFLWATDEGSLERWREYLELKPASPVFSKLIIDVAPDYARVQFRSRRMELTVTPDSVALSSESILTLNFSFFEDGGRVVWDVAGVAVGGGPKHPEFVDVRRFAHPDATLPEGFQANWTKLTNRQFPYNAVASDVTGGQKISMAAESPAASGSAPDAANVRYALTAQSEGNPGQDTLHAKLEALHSGFRALEH